MKKESWNSRCGNKGFILSLDAAIAVLIVFILLSVSAFYVSKANEDPLSRLQMVRAGSDVIAILDQQGHFESLTHTGIGDEISAILPPAYEMRLRVNGTFPQKILTIETTNETPENQFIVGGQRNLVIYNGSNNYYATAQYWMWLK